MRRARAITDALATYVLGAVGEGEARSIRRALDADPWLRRNAQTHQDTAARLLALFEPIDPDESVWAGIEATISGDPSAQSPRLRRSRAPFLLAAVAAAAFLVGVAGATIIEGSATVDLEAVAVSLESDPSSATLSLADPESGEGVASMVVGTDGTAIFTGTGLPELTGDRTYQLWAVVDDAVVSAGLLGSNPSMAALRLEASPTLLAVTVEQAGGVVVSDQPPVAVWSAEA